MKISFEDGGYLEFQRSKKAHHIYVLVAARKPDNHLELLVNSAEIPLGKLIEAVKSVSGPIIIEGNKNEENQDSNQVNSEEA
jgi:hypothetical protein